jgi:hypothetical protein
MIIVTANVGLLPSQLGKKESLYHRQEGWLYPATKKVKIGLEHQERSSQISLLNAHDY